KGEVDRVHTPLGRDLRDRALLQRGVDRAPRDQRARPAPSGEHGAWAWPVEALLEGAPELGIGVEVHLAREVRSRDWTEHRHGLEEERLAELELEVEGPAGYLGHHLEPLPPQRPRLLEQIAVGARTHHAGQ